MLPRDPIIDQVKSSYTEHCFSCFSKIRRFGGGGGGCVFIFFAIPASNPDVQVKKTHSKYSCLLDDEFYAIYKSAIKIQKSRGNNQPIAPKFLRLPFVSPELLRYSCISHLLNERKV